MKNYFFVFGRDRELSLAELLSYFNVKKVKFKIEEDFGGVLIISLPALNCKKMIKELGGVVKIGEIISDFSGLYKGNKNKINYGISIYKNGKDVKKELKEHFKGEGLKAILKNPKREGILSPSEIIKNDILEVMIHRKYVAKTIAVFDPFEYEKRDLGRPRKDFIRMSSIRLSKILVNLSQTKGRLLDPFCGYGTILQEGMLNGLNVVGCDKDSKAVKDCEENLKWLKRNYDIKKNYKLFNCDVKDLSRYVKKVDGVATEPYLGPYLKTRPSYEKAKKNIGELTEIYSTLLRELNKILVKGGRIAIIVPRFRTSDNKIVKMDFLELVRKAGFRVCGFEGVELPVIYLHKILEREIWVLGK